MNKVGRENIRRATIQLLNDIITTFRKYEKSRWMVVSDNTSCDKS